METIDRELQRRVWQRVQGAGSAGEDPAELLELIAGEWIDSAAYLQLSKQYRGKNAALLRRMHSQERSAVACLKGVYNVLTGRPAIVKAPPLPKESREAALRRCYHREVQCMALYRKWTAHPQFGPVFERLCAQAQAHCSMLLELIGRLAT